MTFDGNQHYTYDAWNRLVAVHDDNDGDGAIDTGELLATYEYDGTNRRTVEDVESGSQLDNYYNSGWQLIEVHEDGDTDNPLKQFVWDLRYIDSPVVRFHDSNTDGTLDDTLYYTTDANMNVTALVDASGNVVERYHYDTYGKVIVLHGANGTDPDVDGSTVNEWDVDTNGSDVDNRTLFTGYHYDSETGLYLARNRVYHPTTGRWIQRDPIGYADGMSIYEYVNSNPQKYLDPLGYRGYLPDFVKIAMRTSCYDNCIKAHNLCESKNHPKKCMAQWNTCTIWCGAARLFENNARSAGLVGTIRDNLSTALDVYGSGGVGEGVEGVAGVRGVGPKGITALKGLGAAVEIFNIYLAGRSIGSLKDSFNALEIEKRYNEIWIHAGDDFIDDYGDNNYSCDVKGTQGASFYRRGFLNNKLSKNDPKRGFVITPCYPTDTVHFYYRSDKPEWMLRKIPRLGIKSSNCLLPDQVIRIDAEMLWGTAKEYDIPDE